MKLQRKLQPGVPRGFVTCRFPYNPDLIECIKVIPGTRYAQEYGKGTWLLAEDVKELVKSVAAEFKIVCNFGIQSFPSRVPIRVNVDINPTLFKYQRETVEKALQNWALLINFETGLGKTATAIECVRLSKARNVCVVAPNEMIHSVWKHELDKWWENHPDVTFQTYGNVNPGEEYGAIILDESHWVKNKKAARSKLTKELCKNNPDAMKLALTGTPTTNEPRDIHHQLDCIFPGRFGSYWKFVNRYCLVDPTPYGTQIKGLNEKFSDELRARLEWVSSRVTKEEVSHLLPPFDIAPIEHNNTLLSLLDKTVCAAFEELLPRVCVMVYSRDVAQKIFDYFRPKFTTFQINGLVTDKERAEILKLSLKQKCILVCTYKSMGTGIDLTQFPLALFAELYSSPGIMLQALGRFSRLNSKAGSKILLFINQNSPHELKVSHTLLRKINDANQLHKAGENEAGLQKALEIEDDSFLDRLSSVEMREEW